MITGTKNNNDVFIFKKMNPEEGYEILKSALLDPTNTAFKKDFVDNKAPIWLLRESRQLGMLTIDCIENINAIPTTKSIRMVLSLSKGWIDANDLNSHEVKEALKDSVNLTAENAAQHVESLRQFIKTYFNLDSIEKTRIMPQKTQQTTCPIYSYYPGIKSSSPITLKQVVITLTQPMVKAITCQITKETFKDPVVLIKDIEINTNKSRIKLQKGQSYEKAALIMLGVTPKNYYDNFELRSAINRLGSPEIAKLESMEEDWLQDAVDLDTMNNPMIIPSSHSYSESTVMGLLENNPPKCPKTRKQFTLEDAVLNSNLNQFIKAWPECKKTMILNNKPKPTSMTVNNENIDPFLTLNNSQNSFQPHFESTQVIEEQKRIESLIIMRKMDEEAELQMAIELSKKLNSSR